MGFGIGLVVGAIVGFFLAGLLTANRGSIEGKIDAYKESVDKSVNLVYELAEQNKKLEAQKKEREFMEKMLKGEPGREDWKAL